MESSGSVLCSQKLTIGPYPESGDSNPQPSTPFL
jgi:hypothetical protein